MKNSMRNCYEVAARLISTLKSHALLCHGWIYSTKLHRMIRHAWVEMDDLVWDYSNSRRLRLPKEDYYREGKIDPNTVKKYSRLQAIQMLMGTRKFEYWTDEQRIKILGEINDPIGI